MASQCSGSPAARPTGGRIATPAAGRSMMSGRADRAVGTRERSRAIVPLPLCVRVGARRRLAAPSPPAAAQHEQHGREREPAGRPAAPPPAVSQAAAVVIQLALSAFGAAGMVQGGIEALKHGSAWLTTAWTAHGKSELITEASKEFLRMLVAIAVAALAYLGAKGNYRNALKIANHMPTGGLPAFATTGSAPSGGAGAGTGVSIGPSVGGPAIVGATAARLSDKEKAALGEGPDVDRLHDKDVGEA